jgi:hypothetical protein
LRRWWIRRSEMNKWRYKNCPRCRCDIFLEKDEYGWNEDCLQCGFVQKLETLEEFEQKETRGKIKTSKGTRTAG